MVKHMVMNFPSFFLIWPLNLDSWMLTAVRFIRSVKKRKRNLDGGYFLDLFLSPPSRKNHHAVSFQVFGLFITYGSSTVMISSSYG
jgi:hypothetical protein